MGIAYADITLASLLDVLKSQNGELAPENIRKVAVRALVDSGAEFLVINEVIQSQLGLIPRSSIPVELADGGVQKVPFVEGISVLFENRRTTCDAVVMPGNTDVLLGAIPIEGMDVVIDLNQQKLIVNPEHPYLKQIKIK
jgi:clan AA aspartic protease